MFKSYISIIYRGLLRNKVYSIVNILGLSFGLGCCLVIYLYIQQELSFDGFHKKAEHTYHLVQETIYPTGVDYSGSTPYPLAGALRTDFLEFETITQIHFQNNDIAKVNGNKYKVENAIFADEFFFDVFDFKVLSGNPKESLKEKYQVFLTQSLAEKFFGNKDVIGNTFNFANKMDLQVVGIIEDPPFNTHLPFSMIISMSSFDKEFIGFDIDSWGMIMNGHTYGVLPENIDKNNIEILFGDFLNKHNEEKVSDRVSLKLQALSEIHFATKYDMNTDVYTIKKVYLWIFSLIGIFILVTACINFINLATAQAMTRTREVGVKKVLGAQKSQLIQQFLSETFILTIIASVLSLAIAELSIPFVNKIMGGNIHFTVLQSSSAIFFLIGLILFVGFLSGGYPSYIMSQFKPVTALRSRFNYSKTGSFLVRQLLVILQFVISITLIICTLLINNQIDYFRKKDIGFDKEAIINIRIHDSDSKKIERLRNELKNIPEIKNFSLSLGAPTSNTNIGTTFYMSKETEEKSHQVSIKCVDSSYLSTYSIELLAGEWLKYNDSDSNKFEFVINNALSKKAGFKNPDDIIGEKIRIGINEINGIVVGVVKDFHIKSFHDEIGPMLMMRFPYFTFDAGIKLVGNEYDAAFDKIEDIWSELFPSYIFEYKFLDEHLEELYKAEKRTFSLFQLLTMIAIAIGLVGLFGLISFVVVQRTKEIGIRKVHGASTLTIFKIISKDFLYIVFIAAIIGSPIAYFAMKSWLNNFAYHVNINALVFVEAVLIVLILTSIAISLRTIKVAFSNPVDALRYE
jgi:putative ABC transport system permease protein